MESRLQPGTVLAGKFRVDRVLGQGGMGVVVAAWHVALEERIALKFLLPHVAEKSDVVQRFLREARNAVKIRSEHVARVTDVGTLEDGMPYMVMEYLEGVDLGRFIDERGALPITDAVDLLLQACEAIAEAHTLGIVHRDLKPANLFLTMRADGSPCVKVLDFGISKSTGLGAKNDSSLTKTQGMMGSPLYMSPEQLNSARDVDTRTDIWALGVILFEMLTRQPPFMAEDLPQLLVQILNAPPLNLRSVRPDCPPQLQEVVEKMLAKNRDQRFLNIGDVVQALAPFASQRGYISVDRVTRLVGGQTGVLVGRNSSLSNTGPGAPTGSAAISLNTNSPWGNTKPTQTSPGTPPSKTPIFVAIGGFVAVLALVGFFVVRPLVFGKSTDGDKTPAAAKPKADDDSQSAKGKDEDDSKKVEKAKAKDPDPEPTTTTTTTTTAATTEPTTIASSTSTTTATATAKPVATTTTALTAKPKTTATSTTAATKPTTTATAAKPTTTADPFGDGKK